MKFFDLSKQYKSIKKEIDVSIQRVINSGQFILGPEVEELEKQVGIYCETKYAAGVNSGTDALLLSLMALDIGSEDEVITTPFSFMATAEVIALRGAKPIFVDIDPLTYNIDVNKIEPVITLKTKAIIPVHLYGQAADMDAIMKIAKKHKLAVIEDAAQAIGAKYKNKMIGSFGHTACLSFFPTKNLGAYGDAGMVITKTKHLANKIKELRQHGAREKYIHAGIGINSRMDSLQAAVLNVKLKYLPKWIKARQSIAARYNQVLKDIAGVTTPFCAPGNTHVYNQYTIRAKRRDQLKKYLAKNNIPTAIHYPRPMHLQPALKYFGYKKGSFPEAEKASREVLSLPIYPELPIREQQKVIKYIKKFYK